MNKIRIILTVLLAVSCSSVVAMSLSSGKVVLADALSVNAFQEAVELADGSRAVCWVERNEPSGKVTPRVRFYDAGWNALAEAHELSSEGGFIAFCDSHPSGGIIVVWTELDGESLPFFKGHAAHVLKNGDVVKHRELNSTFESQYGSFVSDVEVTPAGQIFVGLSELIASPGYQNSAYIQKLGLDLEDLWGAPVLIGSGTPNATSISTPRMDTKADGDLSVVYFVNHGESGQYTSHEVYSVVLASDTGALSEKHVVITHPYGTLFAATLDISILSNGNTVVGAGVFLPDQSSSMHVIVEDHLGQRLSDLEAISTAGTVQAIIPSIAETPSGGFIFTWSELYPGDPERPEMGSPVRALISEHASDGALLDGPYEVVPSEGEFTGDSNLLKSAAGISLIYEDAVDPYGPITMLAREVYEGHSAPCRRILRCLIQQFEDLVRPRQIEIDVGVGSSSAGIDLRLDPTSLLP